MTAGPVVHVVHCIDTEGPLHEPLEATFERLKAIYGIDLPPDPETLARLQRREIPLGGIEESVAVTLAPALLAYNDSWEKIDSMLDEILSPDFRNAHADSFGKGWVYNWFCLDVVGFDANPRRRVMGFHAIFDHYRAVLERTGSTQDGLHFHHHPVPFSRSAHHCATHYFNHHPIVFEILARRIIDRAWFPCANRPGFHVTRPDSHWLMEQFIPFDFASQSTDEDYNAQRDLGDGRYGDWRRAPRNWSPYHPSHDDYQTPGGCRRWIARCLNVGTRLRLLTQADVDQAFAEAAAGKPVVLAFTHHDFRDMRPDISAVQAMLRSAQARHPGVAFRHSEARDAMRHALELPASGPLGVTLALDDGRLRVGTDRPCFGSQPFLALKTSSGQYLHDNLDCQQPFRAWSYAFDEHTVALEALDMVGIAATDNAGNVTVATLCPRTGGTSVTCL